MKGLKKAKKVRNFWQVWLVVGGLLLVHVNIPWSQEGILSFDRFKQEIEPLLITQTYNNPAPGTTCISCHGDSLNAAFTAFPIVQGQPRDNFLASALQIEISNPSQSPILKKPLAQSAGGDIHGAFGNEQFPNTQDANYQTIIEWIEDATRSSVGATVSLSRPFPNPFRFETNIVYFLTTTANNVEVLIFSMNGHLIRRLPGTINVGANRVEWDGRDRNFERMPTGVYFYSINADFPDGSVRHNGKVVFTP